MRRISNGYWFWLFFVSIIGIICICRDHSPSFISFMWCMIILTTVVTGIIKLFRFKSVSR